MTIASPAFKAHADGMRSEKLIAWETMPEQRAENKPVANRFHLVVPCPNHLHSIPCLISDMRI
jgi:hypothetical protein